MSTVLLDITELTLKGDKMLQAISEGVRRHTDELPNVIYMTRRQYKNLKRKPNLSGDHRYLIPEERIFTTPYNAMEVRIK